MTIEFYHILLAVNDLVGFLRAFGLKTVDPIWQHRTFICDMSEEALIIVVSGYNGLYVREFLLLLKTFLAITTFCIILLQKSKPVS